MQSNFQVLKFKKLSRPETSTRLQYLENTILTLQEYHKRAKTDKQGNIQDLIALYETFAINLQKKLDL